MTKFHPFENILAKTDTFRHPYAGGISVDISLMSVRRTPEVTRRNPEGCGTGRKVRRKPGRNQREAGDERTTGRILQEFKQYRRI